MVLGNYQYRDVSLVWLIVEKGTTVFAVGASGVVRIIFFRLSNIFHFSLSVRDGLIQTEIVSKDH